jgi:hypothetical protein
VGMGCVSHHHHLVAGIRVHDVDPGLHRTSARRALIFGLFLSFSLVY